MKLLIAIGHAEIQKFIAQDYRVEISEVAESEEELQEKLKSSKTEVIVISRYLKGNYNPKQLIQNIKKLRPDMRIVYLYGEEDSNAQTFIDFLESNNIFDYYVGSNINSLSLSKLLFGSESSRFAVLKGLIKKPAKTLFIKEMDTAVITIYSNCSNGKSHFAWNMAVAMEKRGYKTTLINLDRGYSANLYFGIEDIYYDLLDYTIAREDHKNILDSCYKRGGLNVVTGRLGIENPINNEDFLKLFYIIRSKSDVVIIDTHTGLSGTTLQGINISTIDFLLFDCDLMHFHMNKLMLEKLENTFIENKTYAIINNCITTSEAYKYIYKQINRLNINFKKILPLSSCGSLSCELMQTNKTPYETVKKDSNFFIDINNILKAINVKKEETGLRYIFRGDT